MRFHFALMLILSSCAANDSHIPRHPPPLGTPDPRDRARDCLITTPREHQSCASARVVPADDSVRALLLYTHEHVQLGLDCEALAALTRVVAREPRGRFWALLSSVQTRLGLQVEAIQSAEECVRSPDEMQPSLRERCRQEAASLRRGLATLELGFPVHTSSALVVLINARRISEEQLRHPIPLSAGENSIAAYAPDEICFSRRLHLAAGEHMQLVIPAIR